MSPAPQDFRLEDGPVFHHSLLKRPCSPFVRRSTILRKDTPEIPGEVGHQNDNSTAHNGIERPCNRERLSGKVLLQGAFYHKKQGEKPKIGRASCRERGWVQVADM